MGWERLEKLAMGIASRQVVAERELVAAMLADPIRGAAMAQEEGVDADDFDQPDLRVMFLACVVVAAREGRGQRAEVRDIDSREVRVTTLRVIKRALIEEGRWNSLCQRYERGMSWSDESLVGFACSHPSCAEVRRRGKELVAIVRRVEEARECFRRMCELLSPPLP